MKNDFQNLIRCIETKMANPFDISHYDGEKIQPINIATGTATPADITQSLLSAKEKDRQEMREFVDKRLISGRVDFWKLLKIINIETFQGPKKPINYSKEKQMLKTVNIDRQVYSKLLVLSTERDVDLREVH